MRNIKAKYKPLDSLAAIAFIFAVKDTVYEITKYLLE